MQINFPGSIPAGQKDSVTIFYQGVPPVPVLVRSFNIHIWDPDFMDIASRMAEMIGGLVKMA